MEQCPDYSLQSSVGLFLALVESKPQLVLSWCNLLLLYKKSTQPCQSLKFNRNTIKEQENVENELRL